LVYLSELNLSTPSAAHIEHYARIVLEHAVRRRYIAAGQQVAELAWNRRKDLDTVKQRAEALVLGASSDTLSRRAVVPPSEWTEHLMEYLGQARTSGLAGVSTGLRDLDTMTLGLSPGLYLVAAATGTGKTAIAGQIALHVGRAQRSPIRTSFRLCSCYANWRRAAFLQKHWRLQSESRWWPLPAAQSRTPADRAEPTWPRFETW
jgi:replicative DNA helicase